MIDLEKHGLRVKPLQFEAGRHYGATGKTLVASGIFGVVEATTGWENGKASAHRTYAETKWFGTEEAAIDFLQADYEARIIATLEIVQQPEVAKLVADAVAAERERCVEIAVRHWEGEPEDTIAMAAEMRVGMKPLSDYEKKVAQMREDFPNGI